MSGGAFRVGVTAAVLACAVPAHAENTALSRPPYAGAYEPQGVDERGLWMEIDEQERKLVDQPAVVHDPALTAFVHGVLCKTVGDDRCGAARVYIIRDRSFNASMAPNGLMVVNTGLLARLHSEAELATVLGHEFAHFERRHSLAHFKQMRGTTDWLSWISLAGAATRTSTYGTQNALVGSVFQFSRAQEAEADALAAQFVRASPYRPEASAVWKRIMEEDDALRQERGSRHINHYAPGFADTHPTNLQRIAAFSQAEAAAGTSGEEGIDSYRQATGRVLPLLFEPLVKGNDFAAADYVIRSRGDALGWDGPLLTIRAELYRERGNPRDLVTARDLFQRATALSDAPAESWRGLGLCALRLGDVDAGHKALNEYLTRSPDASDAATIKTMLES